MFPKGQKENCKSRLIRFLGSFDWVRVKSDGSCHMRIAEPLLQIRLSEARHVLQDPTQQRRTLVNAPDQSQLTGSSCTWSFLLADIKLNCAKRLAMFWIRCREAK